MSSSRTGSSRHRRTAGLLAVAATAGLIGSVSPASAQAAGDPAPTPAAPTAAAPTAAALTPAAGSPGGGGVGDPYFPTSGNTGYDVQHYRVALTYRPATHGLRATTRVEARATKALTRFNLDLHGLTVRSVRVDGRAARWTRRADELVVTPTRTLPKGRDFTVEVRYDGTPKPVVAPDGSPSGWFATKDGAVVAAEPNGAPSWFPANDHPSDKATYTFVVTAPKALQVVANGLPAGSTTKAGTRTHTWKVRVPMASYLATLAIGRFRVTRSTGPGGLPVIDAIAPASTKSFDAAAVRYREILAFQTKLFGRYPFESAGSIVPAANLGYSLETQSRPVYDPGAFGTVEGGVSVMVHETAHQWFGNSVSPRTWRDIWLNEGFASFAEWLWDVRDQGGSTRLALARANCEPANSKLWSGRVADPGVKRLFDSDLVYQRGGLVLAALREKIGDRAFFALLKRWPAEHRFATASTSDLLALAERLSGRQLDGFFRTWLYTAGKPAGLPACPAPASTSSSSRMAASPPAYPVSAPPAATTR